MAPNFLVVDDSKMTQALLSSALKDLPASTGKIHCVSNGKEALRVLQDQRIDVVLLDLNMPIMNGVEVLHHMREQQLFDPGSVIVVSAETSQKRMQKLRRAGVAAYVQKPCNSEKIQNIVRCVLSGRCDQRVHAAAEKAFTRSMEKMVGLTPQKVEALGDSSYPSAGCVKGTQQFDGDVRGSLTMALAEVTVVHLAAEALGTELQDSITLACDALREILNITCGKILEELVGDNAMFRHSLPRVATCGWWGWDDMRNDPNTDKFLIRKEPVLLQIELKSGFVVT
jgi:two-component system chemotaxis response regulator CheY